MLDDHAVQAYITRTFDGVEISTAMGYTFFFYRDDHMRPFATLAAADNPHDQLSQLDRPGVFRLNIGVSRETFQALFGPGRQDLSAYDFTALDRLMPHPDYAAHAFLCVLNPSPPTWLQVTQLLAEAYLLARQRYTRRHPTSAFEDDAGPGEAGPRETPAGT